MPITPLVIRTPFVIRGLYDASTKYNVGDIVIHIVSMVSRAWLLVVDTPAGTAPAEDSMFWGQIVDSVMTATGGQGVKGDMGDEPSDARLNALIANQVLEPSDARLMTLIATLVAGLDFQTSTEVQEAIAAYLTDNDFTDTTSVEELINEAYLNVLRDLGVIQVEYALNPTSDTDWHASLTFYDRHRIRFNNPDAEWNIIMGGSVSTSGGGGTPGVVTASGHVMTLPADWENYNMIGFTLAKGVATVPYVMDLGYMKSGISNTDYFGPEATYRNLFAWDSTALTLTGNAGDVFSNAQLY